MLSAVKTASSRTASAPGPAAAPADTPDKLIAAAERLFADNGYSNVSVRAIAAAAGVNWSLVGYYFRGKEGLLSEVYRRHCSSLNAERLKLLGQARTERPRARSRDRSVRASRPGRNPDRHGGDQASAGFAPSSRRKIHACSTSWSPTTSTCRAGRSWPHSVSACRRYPPTRSSGASTSCSGRSTTRLPVPSGSKRSRRAAAIPAISRTRSSTSSLSRRGVPGAAPRTGEARAQRPRS